MLRKVVGNTADVGLASAINLKIDPLSALKETGNSNDVGLASTINLKLTS